ncbi:MAG: hypothetical protein ACLT1T_08015 [Oscillospiraceae bacterium]
MIYDANMNVLASSSTVETVFIDPNEIAEQMKQPENSNLLDQIARGLGEILDVEPSFVYEQAADKQYRYKVIKRKISEELADEVRAFISENSITGVYLETDLKRYYPNSSLAAQALGFVSSDNNGSEGLEAYYNEELSGTAGKVVTSKGNYGSEMLYTYEKYYDASDGGSLITTIDSTVQAYVEKNLQNAIDKYDIKNGAFCIVMDVNTGEIKAMATLSSYDPTTIWRSTTTRPPFCSKTSGRRPLPCPRPPQPTRPRSRPTSRTSRRPVWRSGATAACPTATSPARPSSSSRWPPRSIPAPSR